MKVLAIIQARMGSTRLPGKVLRLIQGKSMLEHQIDFLKQSESINQLVIATTKLSEDNKIRKYIYARLIKASVSNIIIERTLKIITITITTSRPGIIIGKAGQEVDKLKEELKKITLKHVQINIFEIKNNNAPMYSSFLAILPSIVFSEYFLTKSLS